MIVAALGLVLSLACPHEVCIVDADTIRYGGERVRLAGIDAPELRQYGDGYDPPACERYRARKAKATLKRAIARARRVEVQYLMDGDAIRLDSYGRPLAVLMADGRNVNSLMVRWGHARVWVKGQKKGRWC